MTSFTRITTAVTLGSALLFAPVALAGEEASKAATHAGTAMHGKKAETHCRCMMMHPHTDEGSAEPSRAEGARQTRGQPVMTSEEPEFTDRG